MGSSSARVTARLCRTEDGEVLREFWSGASPTARWRRCRPLSIGPEWGDILSPSAARIRKERYINVLRSPAI